MAYVERPIKSLPENFPAYCIYVPSGMEEFFVSDLVERLKIWGTNMGKNLFVGHWDIGAPEFIDLLKKLGLKNRPFLFLTNTNEITDNSYVLSIDDPAIISDIKQLTSLLPHLLDLILIGENAKAAEEALKKKRRKGIRDLLRKVGFGKKFKITVSGFGFSVSMETER
jgi:hypothetical protein